MNLEEKAHFYALDAIGEIAYSEPFGDLKNDKDTHGLIAINDAVLPYLSVVGNHMSLWWMLQKWPFSLLLPRDGDEVGFGAIMG